MAEARQAKDANINIRVPGDFNSRTKLAAALTGVSASEFMRRAITRALAEALTSGPAPKSNAQR
jgi:uncharacterized protein (DUF1778 family)